MGIVRVAVLISLSGQETTASWPPAEKRYLLVQTIHALWMVGNATAMTIYLLGSDIAKQLKTPFPYAGPFGSWNAGFETIWTLGAAAFPFIAHACKPSIHDYQL